MFVDWLPSWPESPCPQQYREPLDVNAQYTKEMITRQGGIYPGGKVRVYGDFCWGGEAGRGEVYFLPAGQTVQCPRCQHVFEPAARRARAVAPAPIARRRSASDYPEEPLDEASEPLRFRPLGGEWKAIAAMIALAFCVLSYGFQLYTTYEKVNLVQLDEREPGHALQRKGAEGGTRDRRIFIDEDANDAQRRTS